MLQRETRSGRAVLKGLIVTENTGLRIRKFQGILAPKKLLTLCQAQSLSFNGLSKITTFSIPEDVDIYLWLFGCKIAKLNEGEFEGPRKVNNLSCRGFVLSS